MIVQVRVIVWLSECVCAGDVSALLCVYVEGLDVFALRCVWAVAPLSWVCCSLSAPAVWMLWVESSELLCAAEQRRI